MSEEQVKQTRASRMNRDRRAKPRNASLDRRARSRRKEAAAKNKRISHVYLYLAHMTVAVAVSAVFNFVFWPASQGPAASDAIGCIEPAKRRELQASTNTSKKAGAGRASKPKRVHISIDSAPSRGIASAHPPLIEQVESEDEADAELTVGEDFTVTLRPGESAAH